MGHSHPHPTLNLQSNGDERYQAVRRITVIGAVVNLLLALGKIIIGVLGGSPALVADGIHSMSDLLTDIMVVYAAKHGSKDADEEHPYGHGRIETMMTVGLGVLLILVAAGIVYDATERLFHTERLTQPGLLVLAMAAISVLSKEVLYQYTVRVARHIKSNMLLANAWHHRSDAISSIVVIIGVAGTMAGLFYLDAIAAIIVGLMVAKIGWDIAWHSIKELVDTALEPERQEVIRDAILSVDGVRALHILRTRRMGAEALVDVHIQVDPYLSVSEAHYVSERVRKKVIRDVEEVFDVMVHIDPENDEKVPLNLKLPTRSELLGSLRQQWAEIAEAQLIDHTTLHYLDGAIQVELLLPVALLADKSPAEREDLHRRFAALAERIEGVDAVRLYFH